MSDSFLVEKNISLSYSPVNHTQILIIHSILSNTLQLLLNKPINIHSGLALRLFSYDQKFGPLLNGSLRNFLLKDSIWLMVEIDSRLTWRCTFKIHH